MMLEEKKLYIFGLYRLGYNNMEAGMEFLERLVQNTSITGMEFHSDRSGWSRAANRMDLKQ